MSLLTGLAAYLDDVIQVLSWRPGGGSYSAGEYGLHLLDLPAEGVGVALATYGGPESSGRLGHDSPHVQARIRGTADPRDGVELAQGVYNALHGLSETRLSEGTYVTTCTCLQSGPVYLGKDANGRHEFSVNARLQIRNATVHREAPV